jgi:hypothetical protein
MPVSHEVATMFALVTADRYPKLPMNNDAYHLASKGQNAFNFCQAEPAEVANQVPYFTIQIGQYS